MSKTEQVRQVAKFLDALAETLERDEVNASDETICLYIRKFILNYAPVLLELIGIKEGEG